jgi:ankyrin repeat protein
MGQSMETILSNHYLSIHLLSFLNISSTIKIVQISHIYYNIITGTSKYKTFQKCKPNYNINSICNYGNIDILVWFMMDHKIDLVNALIKSARYGNLDMVRHLINRGTNIHARDDEALQLSAKNGHLEMVRYLTNHGADIHVRNDYALRQSARRGHLEVVSCLVNQGAAIHAENDYALRSSVINYHFKVTRFLIDQGADIHADNDYALRWSAASGHLEMVHYLVNKGANIHARNNEALFWSSHLDHLEVTRYLISKGANINILSDEIREKLSDKNLSTYLLSFFNILSTMIIQTLHVYYNINKYT